MIAKSKGATSNKNRDGHESMHFYWIIEKKMQIFIAVHSSPGVFSASESLRTKPEILPIPKISGPDNPHVERKKFAPGEDESFL